VEYAACDLLDAPRDTESVKFATGNCLENQKVESALHDGKSIT